MGDADNEVDVPVEIEEWMDEALGVVNEGLGCFVEFVAHLNLCANQLSVKLKYMDNLRRCFTALNLLIIPVVIALFLRYGTREMPRSAYYNNSPEDGYQTLVDFLMGFSAIIGLPFYLYSAWAYYCQDDHQVKEERRRLGLSEFGDDDNQILEAMATAGDTFSNFLSGESSVDRLQEFAMLLSTLLQDRARLENVPSSSERGIQSTSSNSISVFEYMEEVNGSTAVTTGKRGSAVVLEKENSAVNFPVLYEFKIRMKEKSPELAVTIEPCDNGTAEPINMAGKLPNDELNLFGELL